MRFTKFTVLARSSFLSTPARWVRRFGGVLLLLAVWLLYSANVGTPLVFDDQSFFGGNYTSVFGGAFRPDLPRFWPYASFAHQHLLFGQSPEEMHTVNFLLHGLCLLFLQALIAKLLATADANDGSDFRPTVRHELVAFCVTALFAVHPAAVYAVAYLVQRSMLVGTFFSLLMWQAYLMALQGGAKRWLAWSVVFYYFAAFSKEHAVLAPLFPLGLTVLLWKARTARAGAQPSLAMLATTFGAYALIAVAVTLPAVKLLGTGYEPLLSYFPEGADWHQRIGLLERMHWMSILTQCGLFFKYLWLWLWPDPTAMSIDMREPLLSDLSIPGNWLGLFGWLAFGVLMLSLLWYARRSQNKRIGLFSLGLLTIWGLFIVELMTVRWQEIFVLYRSYLWMTGLAIALAVVLNILVERLRSNWVLLLCVPLFILLVNSAQQRLQTFTSELSVWNDAVQLIERRVAKQGHVVGDERAYNNRGVAYARAQDYQHALADYGKAISLNPNYEAFYQSRGKAQAELGQYQDALASFEKALAIRPSFMSALVNHALTLERMGRKGEALTELERACDAGEIWGCIVHHKRTRSNETLIYLPKRAAQ